MQVFISLCVLSAILFLQAEAINNAPKSHDWQSWKVHHGKSYVSARHEAHHKATFEKNRAKVEAHNQKFKEGKVSFHMELNKFSDIDAKEFAKTHMGWIPSTNKTLPKAAPIRHRRQDDGGSFDWRDKGGVSPIKNQQSCGSCWAFSATGAIESQVLIAGSGNAVFSEQQLVDCSGQGCGGGMYTSAWDYIQQAGGIETEDAYPYTAQDGNCQFDNSQTLQQVTGYQSGGSDENEMAQILQSSGPLSIALRPVGQSLQQYSGGIFSCDDGDDGHAVLAVGYGSDNGQDYWIVKNSWGEDWGEQGYFKLARGQDACGVIDNGPAYPTIS